METLLVDCRRRSAVVEIVGTGPDVVLVGTAAPMLWTRPAALALANLGFRVLNFDYGAGADEPEPRSALDQVDDVLAVMDATDVATAAVVGLSRGAMTAYGLAARHPARASHLVLGFPVAGFADTLGIYEPEPEPEPGESSAAFMRRSLGLVFSAPFLESNLAEAIAIATTPSGEVTRLGRDVEEPFDDGERVGCPTLVIEAGSDRAVSSEHPSRYLEAIPGAQHVIVPGATHGWLMEDPEGFAEILAGFLSSRQSG